MLYNQFLERLVLPAGDFVFRSRYAAELRAWRRCTRMSSDEVDALQARRLASMLAYAREHIPYYRDFAIAHDDDARRLLARFPLLSKTTVKSQLDRFVHPGASNLDVEFSSGSSGVQGKVFLNQAAQSISRAATTHIWEWAGFRLGENLLQLGMGEKRPFKKRLKDRFFRVDYELAFKLSESEIRRVLEKNRHRKSLFFVGYASALYTFAQVANRHGLGFPCMAVVSFGDKMFDHYRREIQAAFSCKVYNTYGATEGFVIAGECEAGRLHILSPHVVIEVLDGEGRPAPPGEMGRVHVTTLDNFAMPLIRYSLGDLVTLEDPIARCSCGRPYPMLRTIIGRDTDIVATPAGQKLIVHFFTAIFEYYSSIRQFKVVQRTIAGIEIQYIPDTGFQPHLLNEIEGKIRAKLDGESFQIAFRVVDEIRPAPSGKPQIIESRIASQALAAGVSS